MSRFYTAAAITAAILGLQPLAGQQLPAEPGHRVADTPKSTACISPQSPLGGARATLHRDVRLSLGT